MCNRFQLRLIVVCLAVILCILTVVIGVFCQVNNAGCMVHEKRIDNLGFETNFATNALAVHILTERLIPLLRKSSDPRVVCLSNLNRISL